MQRDIVLYSGGMDSFILWQMLKLTHPTAENLIRVFFKTGTSDNDMEFENLAEDSSNGHVHLLTLPLGQIELANKIVPFRNFLFVLMAANLGNHIYIGATIGDTTRDKDFVFKGICDTALNYFGSVHEKMPYAAEQFSVEMPFKRMTKTEILQEYISNGLDPELLYRTRSCYGGGDEECGTCRACLRKYVAFKNNGLENFLHFKYPIDNDTLLKFYSECILKKRNEKEILEVERVLNGS